MRARTSSVALLLVVLAACGSDPAETSPTSTATRQSAPGTSTSATAPTSSTTTAPSPTTAPAPPVTSAGWSNVALESLSSKAIPPCCADTWHGEVSPPLAPESQPLADGQYAVDLEWPQDVTHPLELELFRFEQCALLPEFSCEPKSEPYVPDELGIDTSASRPLKVVLDDSVEVVVVGWNESTPDDPDDTLDLQKARGSDLAALATEVEAAYADVFADRFSQGEDPDAIIADVLANPTAGFSPSVRGMNHFVFTPERGPSLLFQDLAVVFPIVDDQRTAGRGTDVLAVGSIEVVDGQVTLYVYSGYYP